MTDTKKPTTSAAIYSGHIKITDAPQPKLKIIPEGWDDLIKKIDSLRTIAIDNNNEVHKVSSYYMYEEGQPNVSKQLEKLTQEVGNINDYYSPKGGMNIFNLLLRMEMKMDRELEKINYKLDMITAPN